MVAAVTVRKGASTYVEIHAVRMSMSVVAGTRLLEILDRCPADVADRVHDQLWLRSTLVEQRRRTRIAERDAFDARADAILEALDPDVLAVRP